MRLDKLRRNFSDGLFYLLAFEIRSSIEFVAYIAAFITTKYLTSVESQIWQGHCTGTEWGMKSTHGEKVDSQIVAPPKARSRPQSHCFFFDSLAAFSSSSNCLIAAAYRLSFLHSAYRLLRSKVLTISSSLNKNFCTLPPMIAGTRPVSFPSCLVNRSRIV